MYTVKNNESIVDVCLNSTGDLSSWETILNLNGFTDWNPDLYNGQVLQVPIVINPINYQQLQLYPVNNFENFDTTQFNPNTNGSLVYILNHVIVKTQNIVPISTKKQIYIVSTGETIVDVVLNATGSLDNWETILNVNNFTDWNPDLYVGQEIIIEYLDLQINNIIQFISYPINSDPGINDLDVQIDNLISKFGIHYLFEPEGNIYKFEPDGNLYIFE